jgi:hypothetical protein
LRARYNGRITDRGDGSRAVLKRRRKPPRAAGTRSRRTYADLGKSHWPKYVEGCERAGRIADHRELASGEKRSLPGCRREAYATDPNGPYVYYYHSLFTKLKRGGRTELFKTHRDQPDDGVTLESICDKLIIHGTAESVADQLLAFQEETGPFGTLLYAGKDWKDRELGRQSMILMAEKVMPLVSAGMSSRSNAAG